MQARRSQLGKEFPKWESLGGMKLMVVRGEFVFAARLTYVQGEEVSPLWGSRNFSSFPSAYALG